jgi:hypothetical protein
MAVMPTQARRWPGFCQMASRPFIFCGEFEVAIGSVFAIFIPTTRPPTRSENHAQESEFADPYLVSAPYFSSDFAQRKRTSRTIVRCPPGFSFGAARRLICKDDVCEVCDSRSYRARPRPRRTCITRWCRHRAALQDHSVALRPEAGHDHGISGEARARSKTMFRFARG